MHKELFFSLIGAIGICIHEIEILFVLQRFTCGTILNPVFVVTAEMLSTFDNGDRSTQQANDKSDCRVADCIVGQQRNGCINDKLCKLQPLVNALRLLGLFIVPPDLIIQAVLNIAMVSDRKSVV